MDSFEWHFRLAGDEFDIDGLIDLFGKEIRLLKNADRQTELVLDLPLNTQESQAARDAAEELLAKLNAVAQVMYGNHENLRIVGVGLKDPSGAPMRFFVQLSAGIRSRARVGANITVAGGTMPVVAPRPIGDKFLAAADRNEHLDRALYLLGSLPLDWRGLYMVLEAAQDGNSGEHGLIGKKWVRDGQIKDFKATANSYKALRLAARHGTTKEGIEKPRMTLAEAKEMVRTILEKWAKE